MNKLRFTLALVVCCLAGVAVADTYQLPQPKAWVYEGGTSPEPVRVTVTSTEAPAIEARLPDLAMFWVGEFWSFKSGTILIFR